MHSFYTLFYAKDTDKSLTAAFKKAMTLAKKDEQNLQNGVCVCEVMGALKAHAVPALMTVAAGGFVNGTLSQLLSLPKTVSVSSLTLTPPAYIDIHQKSYIVPFAEYTAYTKYIQNVICNPIVNIGSMQEKVVREIISQNLRRNQQQSRRLSHG